MFFVWGGCIMQLEALLSIDNPNKPVNQSRDSKFILLKYTKKHKEPTSRKITIFIMTKKNRRRMDISVPEKQIGSVCKSARSNITKVMATQYFGGFDLYLLFNWMQERPKKKI